MGRDFETAQYMPVYAQYKSERLGIYHQTTWPVFMYPPALANTIQYSIELTNFGGFVIVRAALADTEGNTQSSCFAHLEDLLLYVQLILPI